MLTIRNQRPLIFGVGEILDFFRFDYFLLFTCIQSYQGFPSWPKTGLTVAADENMKAPKAVLVL
jgi:hypothetical protein